MYKKLQNIEDTFSSADHSLRYVSKSLISPSVNTTSVVRDSNLGYKGRNPLFVNLNVKYNG